MTSESLNIVIKPAKELSNDECLAISIILGLGYHNSDMGDVFKQGLDLNVKQLCAFATNNLNDIVAFCCVKQHETETHYPINQNYPSIHFKHMAVHPKWRGHGIGSALIKEIIPAAHEYFQTEIIWSGSAELGAIKLYSKLGVWIDTQSVEQNNPKLSPEDNKKLITEMMHYRPLNQWRLQKDITFAFVTEDAGAKEYLFSRGYKQNVFNHD